MSDRLQLHVQRATQCIYKMRIYAVCIYAVWNTCGSRQNMTMCGGRAARFGFFLFSDNNITATVSHRIAIILCVYICWILSFLVNGWNCHYYSIQFLFFIFIFALLLCLPFHCMEFALRKSRNKSMRSYDRKQQCLFVFLLLTNETKSHLSNILKNLQTPRFVVLLLLLLLFSFDMHFFRFYYFRCMSINTHIAISYCNNRIFMHLFCDFKSMILA